MITLFANIRPYLRKYGPPGLYITINLSDRPQVSIDRSHSTSQRTDEVSAGAMITLSATIRPSLTMYAGPRL